MLIAKRTLYLDREGNVTDDPEAGTSLLCREGCAVEPHIAEKYADEIEPMPEPKNPAKSGKANKNK